MLYDDHPLNPQRYPMSAAPKTLYYAPAVEFQEFSWTKEFEEFLSHLHSNNVDTYVRVPYKTSSPYSDEAKESLNPLNPKIFAMDTYKIGGTSGENGGSSYRSFQIDERPAPKKMERILELFWPDVTNKIRQACEEVLVKKMEWTVNEYYGDSSTYCCEAVDLEKMFVVLKHYNKLSPQKVVSPVTRIQNIIQHAVPVVEQKDSNAKHHVFKVK